MVYASASEGASSDSALLAFVDRQQGELHPATAKRRLAKRIVELYHSPEAALEAERRFDIQFRDRGVPDGVLEVELADLGNDESWSLPEALAGRLVQRGKRRFLKIV